MAWIFIPFKRLAFESKEFDNDGSFSSPIFGNYSRCIVVFMFQITMMNWSIHFYLPTTRRQIPSFLLGQNSLFHNVWCLATFMKFASWPKLERMKIGEKIESVQNSTHVRRVLWKTINAHLMNVIRINVPFIGHFASEKLIAFRHDYVYTNILNLLKSK